VTTEEAVDVLQRFTLFEGVDEGSLRSLVEQAQEFDFPRGHVIAREGQLGTGMFLILKGTVNIVRHGVTVDTSGPGEIVGELSLLDQAPRIASLVASDDVVCLGIASWHVEKILKRPDLAERLHQVEEEHRRAEAARRSVEPKL
jgi:CRP-like cAMP-binding protein